MIKFFWREEGAATDGRGDTAAVEEGCAAPAAAMAASQGDATGQEGARQFFSTKDWEALVPIERKRIENVYKSYLLQKELGMWS